MLNVFQTCLKGFKLKKLVVEPKTTQPVEPDEELIDRKLNRSRSGSTPSSTDRGPGRPPAQSVKGAKNFFFLLKRLFNRSRLNLNLLRFGQGLVEAQWSPAKHLMLTASQPVDP